METKNEELKSIKEECLKWVELAGRNIIVVLKGVSRSGMMRNMDFYVLIPLRKSEIEDHRGVKARVKKVYLNYFISQLLDYKRDKDTGRLKISGCGMDMAFSVVYNLGRCLYPKGDGKTITGRNGDKNPETDGGYLLNYELL
jgi:hypothetical protein